MTDSAILNEDTKPATEKTTETTTTTTGLREDDKRRIKLGAIIGGAMFLGILIAIIVLVSTEEVKPRPVPPRPIRKHPYYNPFVVADIGMEDETSLNILIHNNRTMLEKYTNDTPPYAPFTMPTALPPPFVRNTTENDEPIELRVLVNQLDEHLLNVKYVDATIDRWEVPEDSTHGYKGDIYARVSKLLHTPLGFHSSAEKSKFEWRFNGKSMDILPIITTEQCRLQYFDKYIEFEARLQTNYIFGMGERMESFQLKTDNYSLWNRYYPYDLGQDTEPGMYGSHPFILNRLKNNKDFIGIFMRNSNAMLFSMWNTMNSGTFINYKMVGGIIDLYVFHAADPDYILKKYHSVIGRPYLPPLWSMGFQQARSGYTLKDLKTVVNTYQEHKIPIDGIWADSEMNDNFKTFTVSKEFEGLKEFVQSLHDPKLGIDMRFVAVANPGIKKEAGYKIYDDAIKQDCLVKSAVQMNQPYEGRTMAGSTVWLDFLTRGSDTVWSLGLHSFHEDTQFDGVWVSENEIDNLCNGECRRSTYADGHEKSIPNPFHNASEFDYLQYRPTLDPLETNTLPMSAFHFADDLESMLYNKQYNMHNLYGMQSARATYDALFAIIERKRSFIASRSTWPGSGQFSSHWLDSNYATWSSMYGSIASILNFNMFGIPHVGAPIGGYFGDANAELLARWYELGCFYPLMLTYSNINTKPKEAYAFPEIEDYIKGAMLERYRLLRFMYTKMFEAYAWGGPVVHPVFFDFPEEEELYKPDVVDRTFMWAKTLYVIPVLIQGQQSTGAYLPNWRWYDLRSKSIIADYKPNHKGNYYYFEQPLGHITVLIKGGSIIPYQHLAHESKVMNVEDLQSIPAQLIVAPDHEGKAIGSMIVDSEGIRPYPDPKTHSYRHYTFTYMNQIFRINKLAGFDFHEEGEFDYFWELLILDVFEHHQVDYACMMDTNMNKQELQHSHTVGTSLLSIHDLDLHRMPMHSLESIVWGSVEEHDFCSFEVHLSKREYQDNDRVMIGELSTSDPSAYELKFDLKAAALSDQIVSMQIAMNDPKILNWVVPDVVDEKIRTHISATRRIEEVGFRTSDLYMPFSFEMSEPDDPHDFLFTSRNLPFVYVRNFIHMKFMVNSRHIFGLGERVSNFELADGIYSLWTYDHMHEETGLPPGNNMYGMHPFYLFQLHNPKEFGAVFFLNSNAMDIKIRHVGMQTQIDHIFCGGIIDAFFFQRGTVDEVLRNYHYVIGRPAPLPYWAFGYHQSRWGYRNMIHLMDIVNKFDQFNIPLDAIWMDKDFMYNYRSFTVDGTRWRGLYLLIQTLHAKNKQFVAIVDPSVAVDPHFSIYTEGYSRGAYILSSFGSKDPLVGVTWPGYSVWFDFLNSATITYWEELLYQFHSDLPFDGLWLDMNEPSNFCDGECPDEIHYHYYYFPLDYYDDMYYNPTHRPLEHATVSMEAMHYGPSALYDEFNYHSLYGFYESRATSSFFYSKLNTRPFIVSSSTFPGSGHYAAHWLGDNYSSWHFMQYSIAGMMDFQLFGIPFVGADICGFQGNATLNLCCRWMQLGAFYPFMRNHNGPDGKPQEPVENPKLASVSRKAIHLRYSLLRYMYTLYMHTVLYGGMMVRPLLFEFADDPKLYKLLDTTFMMGSAIRVTPVLDDDVTKLVSYFPNSDWYEYPSFKKVMSYNDTADTGKDLTLECSLDSENINAHIRGGSIFPRQPHPDTVLNVYALQDYPIELVVVPDQNLMAKGEIYYDDEHHTSFRDNHKDFTLEEYKGEIKIVMKSGNEQFKYDKTDIIINNVKVLNAKSFANTLCAKVYDTVKKDYVRIKYKYDSVNEILDLSTDTTVYNMTVATINSISWYNTATC